MIDFIRTKNEFIKAQNQLKNIINIEMDIVDNPFLETFEHFQAFEFDRIYGKEFYQCLIDFLRSEGSNAFNFYTLLPDAEDYFFHYFSKYSVAKISIYNTFDEFWEFLDTDPGNPADALLHNAETSCIYSNNMSWGIIGSRDLEIGIIGFKSKQVKSKFISYFSKQTFIDIYSRFSDLDEMLKLHSDTKAIHSKMIKKYSQKAV